MITSRGLRKRGGTLFKRMASPGHRFSKVLRPVYRQSLLLPVKARSLAYRIRYGVPAGEIFLQVATRDLVYVDVDPEGRWGIVDHSIPGTVGRVRGGDWDLSRSVLETWRIYRAIRHFVIEGGDLRDTDYYDDGVKNLHYSSTGIWYRITEKNYEKESNRIRNIYESMLRDGYRTQKEIGSCEILDEIRVKIGRDGDFLFENSVHRMVLSQLLGVESVLAVVTFRHLEWDLLRRKLYREARRAKRLGLPILEPYLHPDLRSISCTAAGLVLLEEHQQMFGAITRPGTRSWANADSKPAAGPSPLISVIITCYNSEEYIADSVKSVLGQTHRNLECIVVDDGSTDGTRGVVEELQKTDGRLRYFYKKNGGAASARNFGFERATGDWLQTLDADDWIAPEKLERQLRAALALSAKAEGGVLVYSDYEIVYEDDEHRPARRLPALIGGMTKEQLLRRVVGRQFGLATPSPLTMNSMLLSRSICEKHKFNEAIRCAEDLEYYYRILQDDIRCAYVPMCSMSYRQNTNSLSKDPRSSLVGYTGFLEAILRTNPRHLAYFPNLHKMIRRAYALDDAKTLERLRIIIMRSKIPIYIQARSFRINVRTAVSAAFAMRCWRLGIGLVTLKRRGLKVADTKTT